MNGSIYSLDNLRPYFYSYLFNNGNSDLLPINILYLISFAILVQYCFMAMGIKIGNKIGVKKNYSYRSNSHKFIIYINDDNH